MTFARLSGAARLCAPALLLAATPAAADDFQGWVSATAVAPAADKLVVNAELHTRFYDDASRLGQLLVRPSLEYRVRPRVAVALGYAYIRTDPGGAADAVGEHRVWQQAGYRMVGAPTGFRVTARSRLEQRFRPSADGVSLRLRQVVRVDAPLPWHELRGVAWTEPFINLNEPAWAARGIDQWRSFAGLAVPVSGKVTIEPGYLNQIVVRPGPNLLNHIAAVSTTIKW